MGRRKGRSRPCQTEWRADIKRMEPIRSPAVAGLFYPDDAERLREEVRALLAARPEAPRARIPKAIIVPHAGYVYSGAVAAAAYARVRPAVDRIERVVLMGPAHRVALRGLAVSGAQGFATPLGVVPIDRAGRERVLALPQVQILEEAHAQEHSLEVQLPFLQELLGAFSLLPLVAGDASAADVAGVLDAVWGGPETLIVISSDLSHYHAYAAAQRMDRHTSDAIEAMRPDRLDFESACGRVGIRGLLESARRRELRVETLDLRNSGDTAGPRDSVVGYGAYAFA